MATVKEIKTIKYHLTLNSDELCALHSLLCSKEKVLGQNSLDSDNLEDLSIKVDKIL